MKNSSLSKFPLGHTSYLNIALSRQLKELVSVEIKKVQYMIPNRSNPVSDVAEKFAGITVGSLIKLGARARVGVDQRRAVASVLTRTAQAVVDRHLAQDAGVSWRANAEHSTAVDKTGRSVHANIVDRSAAD